MTADTQSPVSFRASVGNLPQKGMTVVVEADAAARAALAAEHGLLGVGRFRAELLLRRWKGDGVRVTGRVEAEIEQACVVTLEPVPARLDEAVDATFVPEGSRLAIPPRAAEGEILLDPDGPDAPEPFAGDTIDVGALAEQFFALGIDPYPRAAAAPQGAARADTEPSPAEGPFAALRALKPKG